MTVLELIKALEQYAAKYDGFGHMVMMHKKIEEPDVIEEIRNAVDPDDGENYCDLIAYTSIDEVKN